MLLDAIVQELNRYIVMATAARDAVALWTVLTFCRETF